MKPRATAGKRSVAGTCARDASRAGHRGRGDWRLYYSASRFCLVPQRLPDWTGLSHRVNASIASLRWIFVSLVASTALTLAGCKGPNNPTPPPPPVQELFVTCPAPVTIENAPVTPLPVTYTAPTVVGGVAPVGVTCTNPSGSNFNAGATDVVCTAADNSSPQRRASCVFTVTVKQSFSTGATRFLAFGDSITAGEVEYNDGVTSLLAVEPDKAYPTVLRNLLTARYAQQSITVTNAGFPGEPAGCPIGTSFCGANRISDLLDQTQPQVLLLLQGVVDLAGGGLGATGQMIDGLKFTIRDAKRRGVQHVFLGTLLPEKPGIRDYALEYIVPANDEIRQLAAQENVTLVDVYAAMVGKEATLIGKDGLHPTPEGYQALAGIFFDAIKAKLETVVTSATGATRALRISGSDRANVEVGPQFLRPSVRVRQR